MNRGHSFFLIVASLLATPCITWGQVIITEIMYDPPGSDAGHEWIDALNTGTSSIHLTDLRLRVDGANHKIAAIGGDGTLLPQAHAAITQDAALFAKDVPNFDGILFHASFSLANTSSTVALIDKAGTIVASKTYRASSKTPASKTQNTRKQLKQHVSVKAGKGNVSQVGLAPGAPDDASASQVTLPVQAEQAGAAVAATHGNASLWWMGVAALAFCASAATFAARRVAKREWDITEEANE